MYLGVHGLYFLKKAVAGVQSHCQLFLRTGKYSSCHLETNCLPKAVEDQNIRNLKLDMTLLQSYYDIACEGGSFTLHQQGSPNWTVNTILHNDTLKSEDIKSFCKGIESYM